ncbi:Man1-Src1p-C-terminal domain-containing protein [Dipodascopsis tothii]|uniref:Man1-Src1p-C-terminal domain-containing protein n=1 Tax=Dipodascopsis tothii TaxID=44089 RepID=UPI0034CF84A7
MDDETFYLEEGFDPKTLRVADLRRILLFHDVAFPSSAKKAVLVELFEGQVAPRAAELLAERAGVVASAAGIVNATPRGSLASGRGSLATPRSSLGSERRPGSAGSDCARRKSSVRREDAVTTTVPLKDEAPQRRARTRAEYETPEQTPQRAPADGAGTDGGREGGRGRPSGEFSSANPFQTPARRRSGREMKTPMVRRPDERSRSGERPRSGERSRSGERGGRRASRRASERPVSAGSGGSPAGSPARTPGRSPARPPASPRHTAWSSPASSDLDELRAYRDREYGGHEPPAEFSREMFLDTDAGAPRPVLTASLAGTFAAWVAFIALVTWVMVVRAARLGEGYCGTFDVDLAPAAAAGLPAALAPLKPGCVPCPAHASCFPGMQLECERDYLPAYASGWGGVVGRVVPEAVFPVAQICVPDTEKLRKAEILASEALKLLRIEHARVLCAGDGDTAGAVAGPVDAGDLRAALYGRKAAALSDEDFADLWEAALRDLRGQAEVVAVESDGRMLLASESDRELSLACVVRLRVATYVGAHRRALAAAAAALVLAVWARSAVLRRLAVGRLVAELAATSTELLRAQQARSRDDDSGRTPRFVAVAQLRDSIFRAPRTSAAERRQVWARVQAEVERNANVRSRQMEIHGEIMRVWEWVGELL